MTYKVSDNDIFADNPELKAIPEFANCTSQQLKYVFLAFDYGSPFKKLPASQRKEKAAYRAGYKYEKGGKRLDMNARNLVQGKVRSVEAATAKFMEMQFDEDRESHIALKTLINDIRKLCSKSDKTLVEIEKAAKLAEKLPVLEKAKKELEALFNLRTDNDNEEDEPLENEILSALDEINEEL